MDAPETLEQQIAATLEADPRLIPLLPELLADLAELGASAAQVEDVLRAAGLRPGARVLDLGCGKGAVAAALAERLGCTVLGVDAMPEFVAAAQRLAEARGVSSRCRFVQGDLRAHLGQVADHDAVLLLAVGPVAGDHQRTMAGLRSLVRPGGLIVMDDAYLADGATPPDAYHAYSTRDETLRQLRAHGDELVCELVTPADDLRATNLANTAAIRRRAAALRARHPELVEPLAAYVSRQEEETELLGTGVIGAVWVLRRAGEGRALQ